MAGTERREFKARCSNASASASVAFACGGNAPGICNGVIGIRSFSGDSPLEVIDPFDPNNWVPGNHEYRIYADDRAQTYAIVDAIDYHWAIKWRWCLNVKKSRRNPLKTKSYLRRAVGENQNGQRLRTFTLYLHLEIMKRTGIEPPSEAHCIVDHRDGDTMNCRRSNLRWATHSMNSLNRFGCYPHDLLEG